MFDKPVSNYPFLDVLWTFLWLFIWLLWFWLVITVAGDVFRRRDIGGGAKALWLIFVIAVPFIGAFVYLISQHGGMADRAYDRSVGRQASSDQEYFDEYAKTAEGGTGPVAAIERANGLLASGAITQEEFDALKAKILASA